MNMKDYYHWMTVGLVASMIVIGAAPVRADTMLLNQMTEQDERYIIRGFPESTYQCFRNELDYALKTTDSSDLFVALEDDYVAIGGADSDFFLVCTPNADGTTKLSTFEVGEEYIICSTYSKNCYEKG